MNCKVLFPLVLLLACWSNLRSQDTLPLGNEKVWSLDVGVGYYEALFVGVENQKQQGRTWSLGVGYNFNLSNLHLINVFIGYQLPLVLKEHSKVHFGLSSKLMYWQQNDEIMQWGNIGGMLGGYSRYKVSDKFSLIGVIGAQVNTNLWNKRLSYEETGWPKRVDVSVSVYAAYEF